MLTGKEKEGSVLPCYSVNSKDFETRRGPTFVALGIVAFGWLLNEVSLAWIHERVPRNVDPLPDLWFSWFPEVQGAIRITEYIMLILVINAMVIVVCHQYRWIVARRVFLCAGLSYVFRAFCVTIFQVPVPSVNTYCAPKTAGGFDIVAARLCGDLIVSGHTLTIFTALFTFKHYAPKKLKPIGILFHILAFCAIAAILMARKHYMIDVILGYTVSSRLFMEYHALALSYHENSFDRNILSWSFWSSIVPYFERDAPPPHVFHNRLEWPSSCPQRIRRTLG
ncbi:unnamed protein product, partial [Mesorhabditis belari]|uniref:Sphingomyelin synthase-like domain-containing protein n=1 Tax=Mesorhabditis belari TaxID=2138241 RepID=A0AAF3JA55_9BILA